jgi:hypothetical protein
MPDAVCRMLTLLCTLVVACPIGTNLGLLHLLWMLASCGVRARLLGESGEGFWSARVGDGDLVPQSGKPPGEGAPDVARADDADLHEPSSYAVCAGPEPVCAGGGPDGLTFPTDSIPVQRPCAHVKRNA